MVDEHLTWVLKLTEFHMFDLQFDYPLIIALIAALIVGLGSGILSTYAVIRQQSLLGDAVAHAALPGICLVFILTMSKSPVFLLLGALMAGWLGTMFLLLLTRQTLIKEDTALGIILSVFFGVGIFLMSIIQRMPTARQSGLDTYLFGSVASILKNDLYLMGTILILILMIVIGLWKEFKILVFDSHYAQSLGVPVGRLDVLMTSLLVLCIVIGLQAVGVVLMSALLIAPGIAARQWTDQFYVMMALSALFSVLATVLGVLISSVLSGFPTGPLIVILICCWVFISILIAPKRGLLIHWAQNIWHRKQIHQDTILTNLYVLAKSHNDLCYPHDISVLSIIGGKPTMSTLVLLKEKGLVAGYEDEHWGLTKKGVKRAQKIEKGYQKS